MPTLIPVVVTAELIESAIRKDSTRCMVADAVRQAVPDAQRIEVTVQTIRFTQGDQRYLWITPSIAEWAIIDFDAGMPIEPFEFSLNKSRAQRQRRYVAADEEGRAKKRAAATERRAAKREGRDPDPEKVSEAGIKTKAIPGRRPMARRSLPRTRAYGHRVMRINEYRERDGLLPPRPDTAA